MLARACEGQEGSPNQLPCCWCCLQPSVFRSQAITEAQSFIPPNADPNEAELSAVINTLVCVKVDGTHQESWIPPCPLASFRWLKIFRLLKRCFIEKVFCQDTQFVVSFAEGEWQDNRYCEPALFWRVLSRATERKMESSSSGGSWLGARRKR